MSKVVAYVFGGLHAVIGLYVAASLHKIEALEKELEELKREKGE